MVYAFRRFFAFVCYSFPVPCQQRKKKTSTRPTTHQSMPQFIALFRSPDSGCRVRGPATAVSSSTRENRLRRRRLSSTGAQASSFNGCHLFALPASRRRRWSARKSARFSGPTIFFCRGQAAKTLQTPQSYSSRVEPVVAGIIVGAINTRTETVFSVRGVFFWLVGFAGGDARVYSSYTRPIKRL